MLMKETKVYRIRDYLRNQMQHGEDDVKVTEGDRLQLVDRCYGIVDQCEYALAIADRFFSSSNSNANVRALLRSRLSFQLVVVTSLYISVKTDEKVALTSGCLGEISEGTHSIAQIEAMCVA